MNRAQGATQGFLPQNLHGTHTSSAKSSGRRYVATALLGDGPPAWHLATSAEAVGGCVIERKRGGVFLGCAKELDSGCDCVCGSDTLK